MTEEKMKRKLTPVNVLLELGGHPTPGVVEFEKEADPHQGGILLHVLGDLHLRLVAQHVHRQLPSHQNGKQTVNETLTTRRAMSPHLIGSSDFFDVLLDQERFEKPHDPARAHLVRFDAAKRETKLIKENKKRNEKKDSLDDA